MNFSVMTFDTSGQQSKRVQDEIFEVQGETMLAAAETLGEILVDANHFTLVGLQIEKKHLRFLVYPIQCESKGS